MQKIRSCWSEFKHIIRFCDIFGILVTFRINDKVKYKSIDGGVISIIFFAYSIFFLIYLGIPFIKRKNIDFIYSNKIIESEPFINLTETHFNLAFGIQFQRNSSPAMNTFLNYFNYSIIIKESTDRNSLNNIKLGIKKCEYSNFKDILNQSFYRNNIDDMYCPILNNSINFTLDGLYTDNYFKYIEISFNLTEYGMNNVENVRKLMQNYPIEMTIFFLDTGIDFQSRKKPLPTYINYVTKGLDLFFLKTTELFFSTIEFNNDENLIFTRNKKKTDIMFDKSEDSFHFVTSRDDEYEIGKFILKASTKDIILSRKYQKLPSFVGQLSGVIEQAYFILFIIVTFIERQAIENKLIHKMLKMKGSKNYDMDYYLNTFHKENIKNNIMDLIKKGNFDIEKTNQGGINSRRKSQMLLLYQNKLKSMLLEEEKKKKSLEEAKKEKTKTKKVKINKFSFKKNNNKFHKFSKNKIGNEIKKSNSLKKISNNENKINIIEEDKKICLNSSSNLSGKENLSVILEEQDKQSAKSDIIEQRHISNMNLFEEEEIIVEDFEEENEKYEKKMKAYKKAEDDFPNTSVLSIFFTYIFHCKCWNYQRRKYKLIRKAKGKINYYLEIVNYVKGMQEIDLFKYCLFDKEQIYLLDYLAKPPFRINHEEIVCIYNEFEKDQYTFQNIGKEQIDKVYDAYNKIRNKEDVTFEDLKLLRLINAEVEYLS